MQLIFMFMAFFIILISALPVLGFAGFNIPSLTVLNHFNTGTPHLNSYGTITRLSQTFPQSGTTT